MLSKLLIGLVALLLLLGAAGAVYQWYQSREDMKRFPPPGRLVDVNGLQMHIVCRGSGRPVVVMEAGLTTGSWSWGPVFDAVAEDTEVCAYDRPGMGWSDAINRPADAGEVAARLHGLLGAAAIDGPYVLLGMSAGGVYVREYYRRYPDGIVGMVLVDSSHEQQGDRLPPMDGQGTMRRVLLACRWLQPLGVVRYFDAMDRLFEQVPGISNAAKPLLRAKFNQSDYCASVDAEMASFEGEIHDPQPPGSFGDLPLIVLSQGKPPEASEAMGVTREQMAAQREVWDDLQEELANLSTGGRRWMADNSGHMIQLEQPDLVIEKVTELVDGLRP
jgi:pimeloyl-ACP methyl ester carboxylesterase